MSLMGKAENRWPFYVHMATATKSKKSKKVEQAEALEAEKAEIKDNSIMGLLAAGIPEPPKDGDIVEGSVIALDHARLYIDLPPWGTGVIYGREYMNAREIIKRVNMGDKIAAKVIATSTKDGYIELSLKEARQALIWTEAEEALKSKSPF